MDEKYNLEYIKQQIKAREIEQSGYERGVEQGIEQERERSEKLLAEKEDMLAEKDAIIESLKSQLSTYQ